MEVRKCCGCGKTHPLTNEFFQWQAEKEKSGYGYCCKVCVNTKNKEKKLAERLNSEKYKVKMQEAATGLRECKTCGVEKELTLFQASSYTTVAMELAKQLGKGEYATSVGKLRRNGRWTTL